MTTSQLSDHFRRKLLSLGINATKQQQLTIQHLG